MFSTTAKTQQSLSSLATMLETILKRDDLCAFQKYMNAFPDFNAITNSDRDNFLSMLASMNAIRIATYLFSEAPDTILSFVNQPNPTDGETALTICAQEGHEAFADILLANGAKPGYQIPPENISPLYFAAQQKKLGMVQKLLAHGANVNAVSNNGTTALYMAAQNGAAECCQLLLANGAQVDLARTDNDISSLWVASQNGHAEVVNCLLTHGAPVDQTGKIGKEQITVTPLFMAAQEGHTECTQLLLDAGADPTFVVSTVSDYIHMTPLTKALGNRHIPVCKKILFMATQDQYSLGKLTNQQGLLIFLQTRNISHELESTVLELLSERCDIHSFHHSDYKSEDPLFEMKVVNQLVMNQVKTQYSEILNSQREEYHAQLMQDINKILGADRKRFQKSFTDVLDQGLADPTQYHRAIRRISSFHSSKVPALIACLIQYIIPLDLSFYAINQNGMCAMDYLKTENPAIYAILLNNMAEHSAQFSEALAQPNETHAAAPS